MTLAVPTSIAVMQNSGGASTLSALTLSGAWALSPTWKVGILRATTCEQGVLFLPVARAPLLKQVIKAHGIL